MIVTNWLLLANWLETKHQGQRTRDAFVSKPVPTSDADRARLDDRLQKLNDDPNTWTHWMSKKGLFTHMRMALLGMTKREKAESNRRWDYETGVRPSTPTLIAVKS